MKTYGEYKELAVNELEKIHGNSTIDFSTQLKNSLHTVILSLITLDYIKMIEESGNKVESVIEDKTKTVSKNKK